MVITSHNFNKNDIIGVENIISDTIFLKIIFQIFFSTIVSIHVRKN